MDKSLHLSLFEGYDYIHILYLSLYITDSLGLPYWHLGNIRALKHFGFTGSMNYKLLQLYIYILHLCIYSAICDICGAIYGYYIALTFKIYIYVYRHCLFSRQQLKNIHNTTFPHMELHLILVESNWRTCI